MNAAIDTNVLVRLLVRDEQAVAQCDAVKRLAARAERAAQPLLILLCTLMETEWVLRSRYKLDKTSIGGAFAQLLESAGVEMEDEATVEEALYWWGQQPAADFADCLMAARSVHLGCERFITFDAGAARLPHAALLR